MANIKRGFKRIERVLLVLGCLGALGSIALGLLNFNRDDSFIVGENTLSRTTDAKLESIFSALAFLIPISFAPYIVFKLIVWLVMEFKDDDEVKDKEKLKT